jgi:nucleotide-binding universal stress UspA family protein
LVARTAADLADKTGSELHVVHVGELPSYIYSPYGSFVYLESEVTQIMVEEAEREAGKLLDEQVGHIKGAGGTVRESYLRLGRADSEIVGLAEEIGAGLIVIEAADWVA